MSTDARIPRRADAVRNHDRVLAAARALFARHGLDVPVEEIAARAGVGKATVYRSFPTKEHLIAAIAAERMQWIEQLAEDAAHEPDPWQAFAAVIQAIAEAQAADRSLVGTLDVAAALPPVAQAREAMRAAINVLMERAKADGKMAADADVDDVRVFFIGTAHALDPARRGDAATWRRAAERFLRSIALDGARPL